MESQRGPLAVIGHLRGRRRARPKVPDEIRDKVMVELLALLGPDLGPGGETVLQRIAKDAPSWLAPAVEEPYTGRALAMYRRGFLADLTESYYLDAEEDGSGFHEDGIRSHQAQGLGWTTPLATWYRGPFLALFNSDFQNGAAVLNRMLNHAANARARTLATLGHYDTPVDESKLDTYRTELKITGTSRIYVGDGHVWLWYRGTGVGPHPCMSALQALERTCDQLIGIGFPLATIVATLLADCENLAMVGLIVGLLVRHLGIADRLIDPYLAEPMIWEYEFNRTSHETTGLAAPSDGIVAPERRQWTPRETAMQLIVRADDNRVDELRAIGELLVARARRLVKAELGDAEDAEVEEHVVRVRAWASGLDSRTYEAHQTDDGLYIQSKPSDEIVRAMQHSTAEVQRAQDSTRLLVHYHIRPMTSNTQPVSAQDLITDLAVAQELLENPHTLDIGDRWDTPAAVVAVALEAHLIQGVDLPEDALRFAVDTVLRICAGEASPRQFESEMTYFQQGADRSAARVLPLLLSPSSAALRALVDGGDGSETYARAAAAGSFVACTIANEVRMYLARGLDRLWEASCAAGTTCHHESGLRLAIATMRDCALGDWDPEASQVKTVMLDDPVAQSLTDTADGAIYVARLDPAIRALAPATMADICVSERARSLLTILLAAHRRSLLANDHDMDSRGTHALNAARALLTTAAAGDATPIFEHIDAYIDNATRLSSFLTSLSAAAEESPSRAATAQRAWPSLASHIMDSSESGHTPFQGGRDGAYALAALLPNRTGEVTYLYREVATAPIEWWTPLAWRSTVERWLAFARGNPTCVDQLISFLATVEPEDQACTGLPWIANLVLAGPTSIAKRTYQLSTWLIEIRSAASDAGLLPIWQCVVDALVVAGVTRLASYSE